MGKLWEILQHPDEIYPLLKLKMVAHEAQNQVPPEPHWGFCYSMIPKLSRTYALLIHSLGTEKHSQLRNAICVFYLVLRALDTVEDDTSLATDVKLPILIAFHQHISDRDWHFSCGTDHCKVLMDEFRHVTTAFLELERSCQLVIEDMIMRAGSGMATFIDKEIATAGDYDDYCRAVAGPIALGLSKFFHYPGLQDLAPEEVTDSMALLFQKANIVHDYLEDINEVPKPRKFWPREIWSKYSNQLEDLKDEENSEKAVQCLNEMVTDALLHVEDCLKCVSIVKDPDIFRFSAIPLIMSVGILALCYNNTRYFKERVKVRRGLAAVIFYQTNTMSDVYGALYDFACMMKLKVNKNDPNATKTLSRIESIQKVCRDSGTLNTRKLHIERTKSSYALIMMMLFLTILAICFARLSCSPTK